MKKSILFLSLLVCLVFLFSCKTSQVRTAVYIQATGSMAVSFGEGKVDGLKVGVLGTDDGISISLIEGSAPMIFNGQKTLKFKALDRKYIDWHLSFFKGIDERAAYSDKYPDYEKARNLYQMIYDGNPKIPNDMRAQWMRIFKNAQEMELAVLLFNNEMKGRGFTHYMNLSEPENPKMGIGDLPLFVKFTNGQLIFWIGTSEVYDNDASVKKALLLLDREQYK